MTELKTEKFFPSLAIFEHMYIFVKIIIYFVDSYENWNSI